MAKLEDLNPILDKSAYDGAQSLSFLCPLCRQRMVSIDIWAGPSTILEYAPGKYETEQYVIDQGAGLLPREAEF